MSEPDLTEPSTTSDEEKAPRKREILGTHFEDEIDFVDTLKEKPDEPDFREL